MQDEEGKCVIVTTL